MTDIIYVRKLIFQFLCFFFRHLFCFSYLIKYYSMSYIHHLFVSLIVNFETERFFHTILYLEKFSLWGRISFNSNLSGNQMRYQFSNLTQHVNIVRENLLQMWGRCYLILILFLATLCTEDIVLQHRFNCSCKFSNRSIGK